MKRRGFLKGITGGLILPILPAVAFGGSEPPVTERRIMVIGAGSMGVLAAYMLTRYPDLTKGNIDYLGIDMDRSITVLRGKRFPVVIVPRKGNASRPVIARHMKVRSQPRQESSVLLLTALGGRAGTYLTNAITDMNRENDVFTVATFGLPARLDDRSIALEKLPDLQQATHYSLTVDFADVMGRTGSSRPEFCQSSACIHALAERARQTLITLVGQPPASDSAAYLGLRALPS